MAILRARSSAAIVYETIDRVSAGRSYRNPVFRLEASDRRALRGRTRSGVCQMRDTIRQRALLLSESVSRGHGRSSGYGSSGRSSTPVLRGLSWRVAEGETAALVGRSGCGKSTSVRFKQVEFHIIGR